MLKTLTPIRAFTVALLLCGGFVVGAWIKSARAADPATSADAPSKSATSGARSTEPAVCDEKARAVLDACITVMGGRETLEAITSRQATGTIDIPAAGIKGTIRVSQRADGHLISVSDLGAMGRLTRVTTPKVSWEIRGTVARLLSDDEHQASSARAASLFMVPLKPAQHFSSIAHTGIETIDGERYDRLVAKLKSGEELTWFFNQTSKHLEHEDFRGAGQSRIRLTHTNVRTASGITSPMGAVQKANGMDIYFSTDEATLVYNAVVNDDTFERPDQVRALLDAAKTKPGK